MKSHTQGTSVTLGYDLEDWGIWQIWEGECILHGWGMWIICAQRQIESGLCNWPIEYGEGTLCQFSGRSFKKLAASASFLRRCLFLESKPPCWEEAQAAPGEALVGNTQKPEHLAALWESHLGRASPAYSRWGRDELSLLTPAQKQIHLHSTSLF